MKQGWTTEQVSNGLRRFYRDHFDGRVDELPLSGSSYHAAVPAQFRRGAFRMYPPAMVVQRHFETWIDAWASIGLTVRPRRLRTKAVDVAGLRFGMLTAIEYSHSRHGHGRIWRCQCACGAESFQSVKTLLRGKVVSCGCYRRKIVARRAGAARIRDIAGQRFGRLVAEVLEGTNRMGALWRCRCDCGGTAIVNVSSLTAGNTNSCGCLHRELAIERLKKGRESQRRQRELRKAAA